MMDEAFSMILLQRQFWAVEQAVIEQLTLGSSCLCLKLLELFLINYHDVLLL